MHRLTRDFVSEERRTFQYKLGEVMASALTGFVVGVAASSIVWMLAIYYINSFILE